MSTDIRSAKLVLLKEIANCHVNDSVRVIGIWSNYNAEERKAILEYDGVNVQIDLANVEVGEQPIEGDLVLVIGEISNMALQAITIEARIVRCEHTLDMDLYQSVVNVRDKALLN